MVLGVPRSDNKAAKTVKQMNMNTGDIVTDIMNNVTGSESLSQQKQKDKNAKKEDKDMTTQYYAFIDDSAKKYQQITGEHLSFD